MCASMLLLRLLLRRRSAASRSAPMQVRRTVAGSRPTQRALAQLPDVHHQRCPDLVRQQRMAAGRMRQQRWPALPPGFQRLRLLPANQPRHQRRVDS